MKEIVKLIPGETLISEKEGSTCMYLLRTGTLAVFKVLEGQEKQIGTIYSGDFVGEVSFLDKRPRSATVKAITECELSVVDKDEFEEFVQSRPAWLQALMKTLADRLRVTNEKLKV